MPILKFLSDLKSVLESYPGNNSKHLTGQCLNKYKQIAMVKHIFY